MAAAYSVDLRIKVLNFIDQGGKKTEACKLFGVGKDTVFRWLKLRRETGQLNSKEKISKPWKLNYDELQEMVNLNPDKTLKELAEIFNVSASGIRKALVKLKITRKKRQFFTRSVMKKKDKSL